MAEIVFPVPVLTRGIYRGEGAVNCVVAQILTKSVNALLSCWKSSVIFSCRPLWGPLRKGFLELGDQSVPDSVGR